jgi:hypothetical protein
MRKNALQAEGIDQNAVGVVFVWQASESAHDAHDAGKVLLDERPYDDQETKNRPEGCASGLEVNSKSGDGDPECDSTQSILPRRARS